MDLAAAPLPNTKLADEVRSRVVLSELIGKVVALQKAGKELKGLCPFHDEKTPSFIVNDARGFYHCFGCGAHGDAIRWSAIQNGTSIEAALTDLAKRVGLGTKKGGGGKLTRSETVTVRLDPKLNYLSELAARSQRRTKSSFIEWAVAEALGSVCVSDIGQGDRPTIRDLTDYLWQVDEPDRLVMLALHAPALMNHEEQLLWRLIRENGYLWRGRFDSDNNWTWQVIESSLLKERLRAAWPAFKAVASGEANEDILPAWRRQNDVDDDIPF